MIRILTGDCREQMALLPEASVDAIVTDPPYELGFMGKGWDGTGVAFSPETWRAALRVLKPGGHLLAFSGSRTYHRMVCAIEDAGFEIRDQIMWIYGSGFPKSLDVSKAIDKAAGAAREQVSPKSVISHQRNIGNRRPYMDDPDHTTDSDVPATAAAAEWQGWGTALKPAHEPIVVARKPLNLCSSLCHPKEPCSIVESGQACPYGRSTTVAANVLAFGTGALNIDGCRVDATDKTPAPVGQFVGSSIGPNGHNGIRDGSADALGRWPANLIHDGSDEVLASFPQTGPSPQQYTKKKAGWLTPGSVHVENSLQSREFGDTGSAARFFKECKWDENSGQPANNAASPSGSCETSTAAAPAAPPTRPGQESPPIPDSTSDCRSSTPTRSHASAGLWDSTDTTQITATSCGSNGVAPPATAASINLGGRAAAAVGIDQGSATRLWYSAKASSHDREDGTYDLRPQFAPTMGNGIGGKEHDPATATRKGNHHPTVKPTDLMRYLCRLVTPPGGTVLDPFMGSGSTLKAAELEGFSAIGIELDPAYVEIARRRIASDAPLFAEVA